MFTMEEIVVMSMYHNNTRKQLLSNLHRILPHVANDMLKMVTDIIYKLERMSDEEYAKLNLPSPVSTNVSNVS